MKAPFAATLALAGLTGIASAQDADTVVATVGDQEITLGHMIVLGERLPDQYQQLDDETLFDGILEQLVQQSALAQRVDTPSRRTELTLENERRGLLAGEVVDEEADAAVTDEAVQAAYDETYAGSEPETEYNASHILVETEEEAQSLIGELEGGADFAALAQEHSTGPSGPSGGELGWFGAGAMVPAFDEAVQQMEPGAIEGPLQTQFGWHVIKLNETRQKDAPPLEDVRAQIESQIQAEAVERIVSEATEGAEIEMTDKAGIDVGLIRDSSLLDQ